MPFTTKDLSSLEGETFTLPLCVINKSFNSNLEAIINWGDGSKEIISGFTQESNFVYTKLVDKTYTFPGTYNISILIKKDLRDIFNAGFRNVGNYNMTVLPTTLSYAPSSYFLVADLSQDNRTIDVLLDDSGVPYDFTGKVMSSNIYDPETSTNLGGFTLDYSDSLPGELNISISSGLISQLTLSKEYYFSILAGDQVTNTNSMVLQGVLKRISNSANGITVS